MSGAAVVVIIVAIVIIGWWVDVQRHPIRRCPRCKGTKRNTGSTTSLT